MSEKKGQDTIQYTPGPNLMWPILALIVVVAVVIAFSIMYPAAMKIVLQVGFGILCAAATVGVAAFVWDRLYPRWRVMQRDRDVIRKAQLVQLSPDRHGFGGQLVDLATDTARDLDTGEVYVVGTGDTLQEPDPVRVQGTIRQRWIAALTGAKLQQSANPMLSEKEVAPKMQLPGQEDDHPWFQLAQPAQNQDDVEV